MSVDSISKSLGMTKAYLLDDGFEWSVSISPFFKIGTAWLCNHDDFIQLFLKKLGDLKDEESTSTACREAYDQTLSKHHAFIIRNGAKVAIYTLPTKEVLLKRVCGEQENIKQALDMLPKTLVATSSVFQRIENLYNLHNLHQLP